MADMAAASAHRLSQAIQALAQSATFCHLDVESLDMLVRSGRIRSLGRGALVQHRGAPAEHVTVVLEGLVQVYSETPGGDLTVLELASPGAPVGIEDALARSCFTTWARAVERSRLLLIPTPTLETLYQARPSLARALLQVTAQRVRSMQLSREYATLEMSHLRLLRYLLDHARETVDGGAVMRLEAPRYILASLLHMKPETFSRAQRRLGVLGLIRVSGRMVWIPDLAAAQLAVDGAMEPPSADASLQESDLAAYVG